MAGAAAEPTFYVNPERSQSVFPYRRKKLRRMAVEDPGAGFLIHNGRKVLIIREEFEQFLRQTSCI